MHQQPVIRATGHEPLQLGGQTLVIEETSGSGPPYLHVHHEDDEAWYVLEGNLRFRFADRAVDAPAGSTVFVPAGVPHTYEDTGASRYLIIMTPRLRDLVAELHRTPLPQHGDVMRRYRSEIREPTEEDRA